MRNLWFFLKRFKAYRLMVYLGLLLSFLASFANIGLLALSGWFISAAAFAGLTTSAALAFNFFIPAAGVRFFALLRIITRYGERIITHDATFRLLTDLRVWFYQKLEPLAPACLLRFRSGSVLNRLMTDIESLDNLYIRVFVPTIVVILIWLLVGFFFHFFDPVIAGVVMGLLLMSLLIAPLFSHIFARHVSASIATRFSHFRETWVSENQFLTESILFGRQAQVSRLIIGEDSCLQRQQVKMSMVAGLMGGLMVALAGLTIWLTLVMAIPLVQTHQLNGANLALLALAILASFEVINALPNAYQYLGRTQKSAERILEMATQTPEITFPSVPSESMRDHSLQVKSLCFRYGDDQPWVFKDLELALADGEKLALLGPTGIGKSSFLHLLTRAVLPVQGEIHLGKVSIDKLTEEQLRSSMTMLSQKVHVFSNTIRENLLMANAQASEEMLLAALDKAAFKEDVLQLEAGLDTWVGEGGRQLSGGQQKRLALARAILHDKPIWLLDEPFEGLDNLTRQKVLATLKQVLQDKTVILVTHQYMDVAQLGIEQVVHLTDE